MQPIIIALGSGLFLMASARLARTATTAPAAAPAVPTGDTGDGVVTRFKWS